MVLMITNKLTLVEVESYFVVYLIMRGWSICPQLQGV